MSTHKSMQQKEEDENNHKKLIEDLRTVKKENHTHTVEGVMTWLSVKHSPREDQYVTRFSAINPNNSSVNIEVELPKYLGKAFAPGTRIKITLEALPPEKQETVPTDRCKHEFVRYADPSGGSDSVVCCRVCGLEKEKVIVDPIIPPNFHDPNAPFEQDTMSHLKEK